MWDLVVVDENDTTDWVFICVVIIAAVRAWRRGDRSLWQGRELSVIVALGFFIFTDNKQKNYKERGAFDDGITENAAKRRNATSFKS